MKVSSKWIIICITLMTAGVLALGGGVSAATPEQILGSAEDYSGQLNLNNRHYNGDGILLQEFGGSTVLTDKAGNSLKKEQLLTWSEGNVIVNYADCLAGQKQSVSGDVYGRLGLNLPSDVVTADGNPRFIIKLGDDTPVTYTDLTEGGFWIPLSQDFSRDYNALDNPLQESVIAWRTAHGWKKLNIKPVTEADALLARAGLNPRSDRLILHQSQYNPDTGILYTSAVDKSGELKAADGSTIDKDELLTFSTGTVTVHYADSFANQKQKFSDGTIVYGNLGLEIPVEVSSENPRFIMKLGNKDAFFGGSDGNCFWIPVTADNEREYNYDTNPLQQAVIAWKTESGGWVKLNVIPIVQAEQVLATAAISNITLGLDDSQYNTQGQLYTNTVDKTGTLQAKDGNVLTKDNLLTWNAGTLVVNYADTFANQVKEGNVYGILLLNLPSNLVGEDMNPRCILKIGDKEAFFGGVENKAFAIPLIADKKSPYNYNSNPLQDSVIAYRTESGWEKINIKPVLEYRIPEVKQKLPAGIGSWFDESSFKPVEINGATRYFLQVVFDDSDGALKLSSEVISQLRMVQVCSTGGSQTSMVDTGLLDYIETLEETARQDFIDKYIFIRNSSAGEATLCIPIKQLRPQTTYTVLINTDIVYYTEGLGNEPISWSLATMAVPQIKGISVGSVGEDYDEDEPLIIEGDYFYQNSVMVKFNDISADKVNIKTREDGTVYLEVYLPSGRDRLEPGVYNITVINNSNDNYEETLYGQFSVIAAADGEPPRDGERVKNSDRYSEVIEKVHKSEDTILIKSHKRGYINLNLDELTGSDVLVRKIRFDDRRSGITEINTTSKWADIRLCGVRPDYKNNCDMEDVEIRLGRVEPALAGSLSSKLMPPGIRSQFIEVGGQNFMIDRIEVEMSYQNSNGYNIRVLRYDETYRNWYEEPFAVDYLNQKVKFTSYQPGIFVVVE